MPCKRLDILLAEDNEDDALMIREAFAQCGIEGINIVKDGEDAMAYLRQEGKYKDAKTPCILLLDINMPKKDGFQVLKEIKADPALQSLPVVVLTTSERKEDVVKCYRNGASSYITKPETFKLFKDVVQGFSYYWTSVCQTPG